MFTSLPPIEVQLATMFECYRCRGWGNNAWADGEAKKLPCPECLGEAMLVDPWITHETEGGVVGDSILVRADPVYPWRATQTSERRMGSGNASVKAWGPRSLARTAMYAACGAWTTSNGIIAPVMSVRLSPEWEAWEWPADWPRTRRVDRTYRSQVALARLDLGDAVEEC